MNKKIYWLFFMLLLITGLLPAVVSTGDFKFSLGTYIVDEELYWECLRVGKDGRIYIADRKSNTIKVFSPDGRYLSAIGGSGEGPGFFKRWMGAFDIDIKGEICQVDFFFGNQRITRFTPEGKLIESFRIQDPKKAGGLAIFKRITGDYIVDLTGDVVTEKHNQLYYMGIMNCIGILDGKGNLKRMLHEENVFMSFSPYPNSGGFDIPYMSYMISAYSPARDTLVFQTRSNDRMTIIDLKTNKKSQIPNGFNPTRMTVSDIDKWIEELKSNEALYKLKLPSYKKFRSNGLEFIKNIPIVDRLIFNQVGILFATHHDYTKQKYIVHKFSTDNRLVEKRELKTIPAYIGKDRVYYLLYNEDDETYYVEVKTRDDFFLK